MPNVTEKFINTKEQKAQTSFYIDFNFSLFIITLAIPVSRPSRAPNTHRAS